MQWAQVHELPQSHCGDKRESTLFFELSVCRGYIYNYIIIIKVNKTFFAFSFNLGAIFFPESKCETFTQHHKSKLTRYSTFIIQI